MSPSTTSTRLFNISRDGSWNPTIPTICTRSPQLMLSWSISKGRRGRDRGDSLAKRGEMAQNTICTGIPQLEGLCMPSSRSSRDADGETSPRIGSRLAHGPTCMGRKKCTKPAGHVKTPGEKRKTKLNLCVLSKVQIRRSIPSSSSVT